MSPKTILIFAGTRPEIIKMAPLVRLLRQMRKQTNQNWDVHFCFSGQHLELALPFLKNFEVEPDSKLDLMSPGQSLGQLTSRACAQLDQFMSQQKHPAAVLVQGDTTTAFSAALSAFYHKIPVGHVEAGLRTTDISEPFPEELNRRLITRVASWHYAPTSTAANHLFSENVPASSVITTGNTGIDSLIWTINKNQLPTNPALLGLQNKRLVLVTAHRRENIGTPLEEITKSLRELANKFREISFVLPMHKNPRVVETVTKNLANISNFHIIDPLEYSDLVWMLKNSELILSDSGGIQEEAPVLKKPVLVLRNETERPEAVEYGTSILVGSDRTKILETAEAFLTGKRTLQLSGGPSPYGDGTASQKIVSHLLNQI